MGIYLRSWYTPRRQRAFNAEAVGAMMRTIWMTRREALLDEDISEDVFRDIESLRDATGSMVASISLRNGVTLPSSSSHSRRSSGDSVSLRGHHRPTSQEADELSSDDEYYRRVREDRLARNDDSDDEIQETPFDSSPDPVSPAEAFQPQLSLIQEESTSAGSQISMVDENNTNISNIPTIGNSTRSESQVNFESSYSDEEERLDLEMRPTSSSVVAGESYEPEEFVASPSPLLNSDPVRADLQTPGQSPAPRASMPPSHSTPHPFPSANAAAKARPVGALLPSHSTPLPFPHREPPRPYVALVPPRSAMKRTPSPLARNVVPSSHTPATSSSQRQRAHRRSVSFSDGRLDGKIIDASVSRLGGGESENDDGGGEEPSSSPEADGASNGAILAGLSVSLAPSIRTRRIEGMFAALEEASEWQVSSFCF